MSSSTTKRVVLYRFDRQPLEGFVNPQTYLQDDSLEFLTLGGTLHSAGYLEVKALCFSSEGSADALFVEENLFERRPKVPGLWTRFTFRDGDRLDGILPHNLMEWPRQGYLITPPRASVGRQRVFIPRPSVLHTELRGVVGRSKIAGVLKQPKSRAAQLEMFGNS